MGLYGIIWIYMVLYGVIWIYDDLYGFIVHIVSLSYDRQE